MVTYNLAYQVQNKFWGDIIVWAVITIKQSMPLEVIDVRNGNRNVSLAGQSGKWQVDIFLCGHSDFLCLVLSYLSKSLSVTIFIVNGEINDRYHIEWDRPVWFRRSYLNITNWLLYQIVPSGQRLHSWIITSEQSDNNSDFLFFIEKRCASTMNIVTFVDISWINFRFRSSD